MYLKTLLADRIKELGSQAKIGLYPKNELALELLNDLSGAFNLSALEKPDSGFDAIVICEDARKADCLREFASLDLQAKMPKIIAAGTKHQTLRQECAEELERGLRVKSHAAGYEFTKAHLYECLMLAKNLKLSGNIIELGTFEGGTLALIREMARDLGLSSQVSLFGFDAWDGKFHKQSALDIFDMEEFVGKDMDRVQSLVPEAELVKGEISETVPKWLKKNKDPLVLAFIDTDNYSATSRCLPLIWERIARGGAIVFDHFYTKEHFFNTLGERIAAEDFFSERSDYFNLTGTGVFVKMK